MARNIVLTAVLVVVALMLLSWLVGLSLHLFALVALLVEAIVLLAFLALATWVVASVWKSVMRR